MYSRSQQSRAGDRLGSVYMRGGEKGEAWLRDMAEIGTTLAQLSVKVQQKTGVLLNYNYKFSWLLASLTIEQINLHAYNGRSEVREEGERGETMKKMQKNERDFSCTNQVTWEISPLTKGDKMEPQASLPVTEQYAHTHTHTTVICYIPHITAGISASHKIHLSSITEAACNAWLTRY